MQIHHGVIKHGMLNGGYKSASAHYKTMTKQEIQEMGDTIKNISENDCILFLWVTMPNLIEGIELIEKWGFTYRERIEQLMGKLPRIELFARQEVDGWDCWGNEV